MFSRGRNYNIWIVRVLGIDVGRRRIGFAISDTSGTLARATTTMTIERGSDGVAPVAAEVARLVAEDEGLDRIVVGLPRHLDGTPNDETPRVEKFILALKARTGLPVVAEDERLTSIEAESRLSAREPDWKKRKVSLDAESAAIILQDHLDRKP
jgi:putative Holliday junction resolvase